MTGKRNFSPEPHGAYGDSSDKTGNEKLQFISLTSTWGILEHIMLSEIQQAWIGKHCMILLRHKAK